MKRAVVFHVREVVADPNSVSHYQTRHVTIGPNAGIVTKDHRRTPPNRLERATRFRDTRSYSPLISSDEPLALSPLPQRLAEYALVRQARARR